MLTTELIRPTSIAIIGGSDDMSKPGGRVLKNLKDGNYSGELYVVNPKAEQVQGTATFKTVEELPHVDTAILAIASKYCLHAVRVLAEAKGTKGFIILSAGFQEEGAEGARLEREIADIVNANGASLIGPNCIGMMNCHYQGVFTLPIPTFDPRGVDFISGSGATAVFVMEAAILNGITFANVFSVGNSAQIGVEDVLKYLDDTYVEGESSKIKMLYVESISRPEMLLKHSRSLIRKGCRIAAIKSGTSAAGSRAASSHTGALATPDAAVDALFAKAGIVRCYGREELAIVAGIFTYPKLKGKNIAIITHAGGPAVMLTDVLSDNGLMVPPLRGDKADLLLSKLFAGSSVANPIDFLATGTAQQLDSIIDACEHDFDEIDGMVVIFGNPGLTPVYDAYNVIAEKIKVCRKPIFPIFPSVKNACGEVEQFHRNGRVSFSDEVIFGQALSKVCNMPEPEPDGSSIDASADADAIRAAVNDASNGYLSPSKVQQLLDAVGIARAREAIVGSEAECRQAAQQIGFPLAMKVVGPVHKSDVGGVVLGVDSAEQAIEEFGRLIKIKDTTAVLLQPMLSGTQLFVGAKREGKFGHLVMCGLGGIFVEVLKDVSASLAPVSRTEAHRMIRHLKSYKIIRGVRGQEPVNEDLYAEIVHKVSVLCQLAPEISEMDINPLLGNSRQVVAVDARICIDK